MSTSEDMQLNGLNRIVAVTGVGVGALMIAGAFGHFSAVWDRLTESDANSIALITPGLLLALGGVLNVLAAPYLWRQRPWAMFSTLPANVIATSYFAFLLHKSVADHPIGMFLAVTSAQAFMLCATAAGLRWPMPANQDDHHPSSR